MFNHTSIAGCQTAETILHRYIIMKVALGNTIEGPFMAVFCSQILSIGGRVEVRCCIVVAQPLTHNMCCRIRHDRTNEQTFFLFGSADIHSRGSGEESLAGVRRASYMTHDCSCFDYRHFQIYKGVKSDRRRTARFGGTRSRDVGLRVATYRYSEVQTLRAYIASFSSFTSEHRRSGYPV